ncbi:MAG: hypothetical protein AAF738_10410, partial [Bacteroidota bacterium]
MKQQHYHKLLQRQLKRHLRTTDWQSNPELLAFVNSIQGSYELYERNKKLSQHASEAADQEYQEITEALRLKKELHEQGVQNLMHIIRETSEFVPTEDEDTDNLIQATHYVKRLVQRLEKARTQAESVAQIKADFLSVMSHEIRSPLGIIIG